MQRGNYDYTSRNAGDIGADHTPVSIENNSPHNAHQQTPPEITKLRVR